MWEGKSEAKRGAATLRGSRPKASVMRLHNRAADRQPHAHAVLFRCEESFEHRIRIFQSHPGILYLHQDSIATLPFGTNEEPLVICHGIHRFDAIQEPVEYQLLQLYAISDYRRQVLP